MPIGPSVTTPTSMSRAIRKLADHGVAQVFVHSGQKDQRRVFNFYGTRVLPKLRTRLA
jgi:hypothetical protein